MRVRDPLLDCTVLATDFDRTFTRPDLTVDPRAVAAVRALQESGIRCVLATGRARVDLRRLGVDRLFDAYVLEGGAVWGRGDQWMLAPSEGLKAAEEALLAAGFTYVRRTASLSAPAEAGPLMDALADVTAHRNADEIDIVPQGVDKGTGLRHVLQVLGLPDAKVCGVGDGDNDVPLLRACHARFAVGNATLLAKAFASRVVAPFSDGFLEVAGLLLEARSPTHASAGVRRAA